MSQTTDTSTVPNREFVADHTVERSERPIVSGDNKFKFALFGANVSYGQGGMNFSDNMIQLGNWGEVKGLAQKADRYGLEGFLPIARWQGLAGPDRPWGRQFETLTWAAGIAAATTDIQVFSTCHVPFIHPLMAAKMLMTIDHISGGRVGLNAVSGYFEPEFKMFGLDLPPHDERYDLADEWMTVAERLWADEGDQIDFDFDGKYFHLEGAQSYPKPVQSPGPVVMSAGSSPAGQKFAYDHCQILFAHVINAQRSEKTIKGLRANADAAGREDLALWAGVHIICKDTEKEANDYNEHLMEKGDYESAVRYKAVVTGGDAQSVNWDEYTLDGDVRKDSMIQSFLRSGLSPLVGTPEMIVDKLQGFYDLGITGVAVGLTDNDEGLDRLNEQIFPLMRNAGLRA